MTSAPERVFPNNPSENIKQFFTFSDTAGREGAKLTGPEVDNSLTISKSS